MICVPPLVFQESKTACTSKITTILLQIDKKADVHVTHPSFNFENARPGGGRAFFVEFSYLKIK